MVKTKDFEVTNVRTWSKKKSSKRPDVIFFTLNIFDSFIKIYNCRLLLTKKGDWFISFPSYKSDDGNYYNHVYVDFRENEAIQEYIITEVLAAAEIEE